MCPTTSVRIEPNPVEPGKEVVLEWACDAKEETRYVSPIYVLLLPLVWLFPQERVVLGPHGANTGIGPDILMRASAGQQG